MSPPSSDTGSQVKETYPDAEKERESGNTESGVVIDKHVERRALWKVDLVVIPLVGMYCE